MEELGIGRPSTYASTLSVLRDRDYVRIDKKRLVPEDKGRLVTAFLESFFKRYVEFDFTADLEEKLDLVSNDEIDWKAGAARLLGGVHRRPSTTPRICASPRCSTALNDVLGPHVFPREGGWRRSALLPGLRHRHSSR